MAHAVQGKTFERRYKNFRSQLQSSTVHFTQKRGRSASRRAKCNAHICLMFTYNVIDNRMYRCTLNFVLMLTQSQLAQTHVYLLSVFGNK